MNESSSSGAFVILGLAVLAAVTYIFFRYSQPGESNSNYTVGQLGSNIQTAPGGTQVPSFDSMGKQIAENAARSNTSTGTKQNQKQQLA